ncbi:MAG: ATP-binding cassette domain-containing protein [Chloroflexota bacterium]
MASTTSPSKATEYFKKHEVPTGGESTPLIKVRNLKKYFPIKKGVIQREVGSIKAVDDISFDIYHGETLGLVGESGSGKSTTGRAIIQLHPPTAGSVIFDGIDVTQLKGTDLKEARKKMQMIFQDPYSSLNPRMSVNSIISEALEIHKIGSSGAERLEIVQELLKRVGLNPRFVHRYPHEFSGGQRQRIGIARALAVNPKFIVADEPISALDVSIQAQVVNLLQDLQEEFNITYLFIAHDLSMIRNVCKRVAVMFKGRIVEMADTDELYQNPIHPYTQVLLSAVPIPDPDIEKQRSRLIMDPNFDYAENSSELKEVSPGHWVAASKVG